MFVPQAVNVNFSLSRLHWRVIVVFLPVTCAKLSGLCFNMSSS